VRGVAAVLAALELESPPHRLVLGSGGFDAAVGTLEANLADIRSGESLSRGAAF
jgi:hypothetical protein